jgi:hypothetical protein
LNFTPDSHAMQCTSLEEVIQFIDKWTTQRETYPYETDGTCMCCIPPVLFSLSLSLSFSRCVWVL